MYKKPNFLSFLKYEILAVIGLYPVSYYLYTWVRSMRRPVMLASQVEFVLEGYPRSGNSFALEAFKYAQDHPIEVASHSHAPAQVKQAVKFNLPTLILVRNPSDAVLSMVIRHPDKSIKQALRHYIWFYSAIWACRSSFLVGTFEELNSDYGVLIKRVNAHFGVNFLPFVHIPENVSACFSIIENNLRKKTGREQVNEAMVARPSSARAGLKKKLAAELKKKTYKRLLEEAERWHQAYFEYSAQAG